MILKKKPSIILPIIVIIACIVLIIFYSYKNIKGNKIKKWKTVDATIIDDGFYYKNIFNLEKSKIIKLNGATDINQTRYAPYIKYEYTVNNKKYISENYKFNSKLTYTISEIKDIISNLKKTKKIKIYYNEDDPSESYICGGNTRYTNTIILVTLLFVNIIFALLKIISVK